MPPMDIYVALLRGINVGGNKKVDMKKLKQMFETLGYKNVSTYINSGNVVFRSKRDDFSKLPKTLEKAFGFPIEVVVRDGKNIQMLASKIPAAWTNDKKQRTDVIFLWEGYDSKKSLQLVKVNPEVDELRYLPGAIVWHFDRAFYKQSKMHDFIGTELYKHMTARNINTVRKLAELVKAANEA